MSNQFWKNFVQNTVNGNELHMRMKNIAMNYPQHSNNT